MVIFNLNSVAVRKHSLN